MLPFGSVDETVRIGGNYVIVYQKNPARVIDVLYSESNGDARYKFKFDSSKIKETFGSFESFVSNLRGEDGKERRDSNGSVIGWFGAEKAPQLNTEEVSAPEIRIENKERLDVVITDPNDMSKEVTIKLIIKGNISGAIDMILIKEKGTILDNGIDPRVIKINDGDSIVYVLDDITENGKHFASLSAVEPTKFIPGEDITVSVEAWSARDNTFSNIAVSSECIANSLYANGIPDMIPDMPATETDSTVYIENIRHLENLDPAISCVSNENKTIYNKAVQIEDLDWDGFKDKINNEKEFCIF